MKIYTVDAFTDKAFSGNPAAVCLLDENKGDDWLLNVAAEMNLSETAFVKRIDNGFSLRWFTPKAEVELCGHATLASAHILWQTGLLKQDEEAIFYTMFKGMLTAKKNKDEIILNFPANLQNPSDQNGEVEKALGVKPVYVGITDHHYLVELKSEEDVKNVKPDFNILERLPKYGTIITSRSNDSRYDFVSRFFAPSKGVNEDPVTGSAHCVLAPYWSEKTGKEVLFAYQASERGGYMKVKVAGDRVLLSGKAVTILEGELRIN